MTLTVSTGKPKVRVPDVRGQSVTDAVAALAQPGSTRRSRSVYSTAAARTRSPAQLPRAGDTVDEGLDVRINVSRGREAGAACRT